MNLKCVRCEKDFENPVTIGYCNECQEAFAKTRDLVHNHQRPAPGICMDGKFADPKECPQSIHDPVSGNNVCGLCGSDELESGYGLGTGFGVGTYTFCMGCDHFLDFNEDRDDA